MRKIALFALMTILLYSLNQAHSFGQSKSSVFDQVQASSRNSGVTTYVLSVFNEPYTDLSNPISVNNNEAWDDPEYSIPVSFPFQLNGHTVSSFQFSGVGFLLRAPTGDPDVSTVVFPFETDLIDRGVLTDTSLSPISYVVEGDPGSRILKIEINNAGSYEEYAEDSQDMYINIQLWLYEGSNQVEFRFGDNSIPDPELFYYGGTYMGITDIDDNSGDLSNANFFSGDISAPVLESSDVTIEGTPEVGTVYQLSPGSALNVTITGIHSTSFCSPNGEATAEADGGIPPYTYLWSNGETSDMISNLDAGTYSVTVTDNDGATGTASIEITNVDPIDPNVSATGETSQDANDGTASSNPSGGTSPYLFDWSNGESTSEITGLAPGVYTVTVTDSEGCTVEESVTVNAFECLDITIVGDVSDASCFGSCDGTIEITDVTGGTPPYMYEWNTGETGIIISNLCSGSYTVSITDAEGCVVSEVFFVDQAEEFFANAGATSESGPGLNDGSAWAAPSGNFPPFTYEWSNASSDSLITNLVPGIYTVTVTDNNGCTTEESVEVFPFMCFGEVSFTVEDVSCQGECDGSISAIITNGGIGPFSFAWNTGETSSSIMDLCPGDYDVTITDLGQGCDLEGGTFVEEPIAMTIFLDAITPVTDSTAGAIFITVSAGFPPLEFLWSGPNGYSSTEKDISDLEAGLYTVTVTDFRGCTAISTFEVPDQTVGLNVLYQLPVKIYPNPVREKVFIELPENPEQFTIELINPDGRTLARWENTLFIDVSEIPTGLYFLKGTAGKKYFIHHLNIIQ